MKSADKKLFLVGIILASLLAGIFWRPPDAQAYQVKRVIRGQIPMGSGDEAVTVDLGPAGQNKLAAGDSLDTDRSVIFVTWSNVTTSREPRNNIMAIIDDGTHVLITRRTSGQAQTVEYAIVEFSSGVTVYSGMTTINENAYSKDITIPTVTVAKAFPLVSVRAFVDSTGGNDEYTRFAAELTGVRTLHIERGDRATSCNDDIYYQVVAFDATETDVEVQKGKIRINNSREFEDPSIYRETTDNGQTVTVNLTDFSTQFHAVDASKSFLVFTVMCDPNTAGYESIYGIDGTSDGTTLTFRRAAAATTTTWAELRWCLVTFSNNVLVQKGRKTGSTGAVITITGSGDGFPTKTYSNRSFPIVSAQVNGADGSYRDELLWRAALSAVGTPPVSDTITCTEDGSVDAVAAAVSWFVVEMPPLNLLYPIGGETGDSALKVGQTDVKITWEHAKELESGGSLGDGSVKVKLLLDTNGGKGADGIAGTNDDYPLTIPTNNLSAKADSYTWSTIPATLKDAGNNDVNIIGTKLRVRIQCDDTVYTVAAPKAIQTSTDTSPITINSTGHGLASGARVRISGHSVAYINNTWVVTVVDGNSFTLNNSTAAGPGTGGMVTEDGRNHDESNADFEIRGQIIVTSPNSTINSSAPWYVTDTAKPITWTPYGNLNTGTFGTVRIDFSTDGDTWYNLNSGTDAGTDGQSKNWPWPTIPSYLGTNATTIGLNNLVKVTLNTCNILLNIVSSTNAANSEITTSTEHNYSTGQWVTIAGHSTAINGDWQITVTGTKKFTITNPAALGAGSGGTVVDKTVAGSTSTDNGGTDHLIKITTGVNHGYSNGDTVKISGHSLNVASVNITGSSDNGGTDHLIKITTDGNHGYSNGDKVSISGHYAASGKVISTSTNSSGLVKISTTTDHGYSSGDKVTIASHTITPSNIAITGSANDGSGKIKITTAANIFNTGETITIAGHTITFPAVNIASSANDGTGKIKITTSAANIYTTGDTVNIAGHYSATNSNTAFANNGSGKLRVTTTSNHGYANGDWVLIAGATGNTTYNGTWQISNVTANTYECASVNYVANNAGRGTSQKRMVNPATNWTITVIDNLNFTLDSSAWTGTVAGAALGTATELGHQINGNWTITRIDSTNFTLNTSVYMSTGAGGTATESVTPHVIDGSWTITPVGGDTKAFTLNNSSYAYNGAGGNVYKWIIDPTTVWTISNVTPTTFTLVGSTWASNGAGGSVKQQQVAAVDGVWTISNVTATTFTLVGSAYSDYNGAGGSISKQLLDTTISGTSEPFCIKGIVSAVKLTDAGGTEQTTLLIGQAYKIKWNKRGYFDPTGNGTVNIKYSNDGGTTFNTLLTTTPTAAGTDVDGTGSWDWTAVETGKLAQTAANKGMVRVISNDALLASSDSAAFTVSQGTLTLTKPDAATYNVGEPMTITWNPSPNLSKPVTVSFSTDHGGNWVQIKSFPDINATKTFNWTVGESSTSGVLLTDSPVTATNQGKIKIVADDFGLTVISGDFTVLGSIAVTAPDGEVWKIGDTDKEVDWDQVGTFDKVKISVSRTLGGGDWVVLDDDFNPAAKPFVWPVVAAPASQTDKALIKVEHWKWSNIADTSAPFTIQQTITAQNPDNPPWRVETKPVIKWSLSGTVDNVDILYKKGSADPVYLTPITTGVDANNVDATHGSWTWDPYNTEFDVPDNISTGVADTYIIVRDHDYPYITSQNPTAFKIKGSIALKQDVGGGLGYVKAGEKQTINFTVKGSVGSKTVNLRFKQGSGNYGDPVATVAINNANDYSVDWTPLGTDYGVGCVLKLGIDQDEQDPATDTAVESNVFAIKPSITLTYPTANGLGPFNLNSDLIIRWTPNPSNASFGQLHIKYSKDGGGYTGTVTTDSIASNNQEGGSVGYKWTMSDGNACGAIKVKVYLITDENIVCDNSQFSFNVLGAIALTGEAKNTDNDTTPWEMDVPHAISWKPTGSIGRIDIKYSKSASPAYNYYVVKNITAGDSGVESNYPWTIKYSDKTPPPDGYVNFEKNPYIMFKVVCTTAASVTDESANPITIKSKFEVNTPSGSNPALKIFAPGDTAAAVDWNTYDVCDPTQPANEDCATAQAAPSVPTVDIWYAANATIGNYDGEVKLGYGNIEGYGWPIPSTVPIGDNFKVKVVSALNPDIAAVSPLPFRVIGQIRIDAPKTAQAAWLVDRDGVLEKVEQIKWTNYGNLGHGVTIWYSPTGVFTSGNYEELTTAGSGDDGPQSLDFHVRDQIRSTNTIRIIDNNDEPNLQAATQTSEPFSIKGQLQLIEPKGGESYDMGKHIDIQWKYAGSIGGLFFKYSTTGLDGSWISINTEAVPCTNEPAGNSNYYEWLNLPTAGDYYFRIEPAIAGKCDPVVSGGTFSVKGSVQLDSPGKNAGSPETWFVDDSVGNVITWTPLGGTPKVDITLERDTRGEMAVATGINASATPFSWDISGAGDEAKRVAATSNYCKIRIYVNGDHTKGDVSTNYFKIKPRVFLDTQANPPWKVQTLNNITWTKKGAIGDGELRIYFINGADTELLTTVDGGDLSYGWTINPDSGAPKVTDTGKIKLIRYCDNGLGVTEEDTQVKSEKTFRIVGKISVTSPVGRTTYYAGQSGTISWQVKNVTSALEIRYSTSYSDDGNSLNDFLPATFENIINGCDNIPYTDTSKTFTVPLDVTQHVKFAVCQAGKFTEVYGQSPDCIIKGGLILDANTTQTPPLGDLIVDTKHTFSWVPTGTFTKLKAYYIIDGVKKPINENINGMDTSVDWYPGPDDISNNILFRIEDTTDISDQSPSDKKSTVKGTFEIKSPTAGVNNLLTVGDSGAFIKWLRHGNMGTLLIELYQDGVLVDAEEAGLASADEWDQGDNGVETNANFIWAVPDKIGKQNCKIKITPSLHPELAKESAAFSIKGGFIANSVSSPLSSGADIWYVGEGAKDIIWQAKGHMRKVRLELSVDGTYITNNPIVAEVTPAEAGTDTYKYSWSFDPALQSGLADQRSNACKIHIIDVDNPTQVLESSNFTIRPRIVPATPAQAWIAKSYPQISWNSILGNQTQTIDILVDNDGDGDFTDVGDYGAQVLASGIAKGTSQPYTSLVQLAGTISNNASIRIRDNAKPTLVLGDSGPFAIKGGITVDTPATMTIGETNKSITWTYQGSLGNVNIWADYNGDGTDDEKLTATPVSAGTNGSGSWTWLTVPDHVSNDVILKVVAVGFTEAQVPPGLTQKFAILGKIDVTSPNGDPTSIKNDRSESIDIKWKSWGANISKVKLAYSLNGLDPYTTIDASVDNNVRDGSAENTWTWNKDKAVPIPRNVSSKDVKIRVSASIPDQPATKDECANVFMLCGTIYPDAIANTTWLADGTTDNAISWEIAGPIDTVAIYYAKDGSSFGTTPIISSTDAHNGVHHGDDTAHGSCTWKVPATVTTDDNWLSNGKVAKVKIQDTRAFYDLATLKTSTTFTVKGILDFTAATKSDLAFGLIAGVSKTINWERKGKIASVELRYSNDCMGTNVGTFPVGNSIATVNFAPDETTASTGWAVPEAVGAGSKNNGYALRVIDTANPNSNTSADSAVFTVRGDIKCTGPASGTYYITNTPTVTWEILHGDIANVKVIGSRDGNFDDHGTPGSDMFVIIGSTDADNTPGWGFDPLKTPKAKGSCSWNIQELNPSILTADPGNLKIKVVDAEPAYSVMDGTFATSGVFTIKGALTVDKPTTDWNVGDIDKKIIWMPQGNIQKFNIYFSPTNGSVGSWIPVNDPTLGTAGTNEAGGKKSYSTANWYKAPGDTSVGVPDVKSKECKLKICDFNNPDDVVVVTPDGDKFQVYPKITNVVIVPSVGDGSSNPIIWRADKAGTQLKYTVPSKTTITKVDIYYSPNGAANLVSFLPETTVTSDGENTVSFTSPTELSIGANALVRIRDNDPAYTNLYYVDSSPFRVLRWIEIDNSKFSPDWKVGETTKKVYWTAHGTQTGGANNNVNIYVDYGNGYGSALDTVGANSSPWPWLPSVPDQVTVLNKHAHFKITDADSTREADTQYESVAFKIGGVFSNFKAEPFVSETGDLSPLAGKFEGTKVSWTKVGNAIQYVRLEYNNNNGDPDSWVLLPPDDLIPAGTFYKWTPPAADIKGDVCFLRITDPANLNTTLTSGSFSVKSKVIISEPDGSVPWEVGKPVTAKWSKWGDFDTVNIYYRAKATDEWGDLPIASGAAHKVGQENSGELTFTLPTDTELAVATAQIKVEDAGNPDLCVAVPSATFSTIGSVEVLKPDNSVRYIAGQPVLIRWKRIGEVPAVDVYYSKDGGNSWGDGTSQRIISNEPFPTSPASDIDEITTWAPPEEIGEYMIKVKDSTPSSTIENFSPKFTVGGELELTKPEQSGVVYEISLAGQKIEWNIVHGNITNVKIIGSRDGNFDDHGAAGSDMFEISAMTDADNALTFNKDNPYPKGQGSFTWNFPEKSPTICSNTVKIRVMDSDMAKYPLVSDTSTNPCAIKGRFVFSETPPATPVECDKSFTIKWYTYGDVGAVQLKYKTGPLAAYTPIPGGAISNNKGTDLGPQLTTLSWAPDGVNVGVCSQAQILIEQTDRALNIASAESTSFPISGWFEFQAGDLPADGDSWEIGIPHLIHWTNHGAETPVMLQYWDGTQYQNILAAGGMSNDTNGFYNWPCPAATTKIYRFSKIRVAKVGAIETNNAESLGTFSLHGKVSLIDPTDPTDGKNFKFGKTYPIQFGLVKGEGMKLRLDYAVVSGVPAPSDFTHTLTSNVSLDIGASTIFPWTISEAAGDVQSTKVVIRAADMADAANCYVTTSTGSGPTDRFRIQCTFQVSKPPLDGNAPWQVGDPGLVEWKSLLGTCNSINIWYATNTNDPDPLNWNWAKINTSAVNNVPVGSLHTWSWPQVLDPRSEFAMVKVTDTRDDLAEAVSGQFYIKGNVDLLDPNTHQDLDIGANHTIKWKMRGGIQKLNIYYSLGSDGYAYHSEYPGNPIRALNETSSVPEDKISYYYNATSTKYEYPWSPIPDKPHNQAYVVVMNPDDTFESDISSDHSTIQAILALDPIAEPLLRVGDEKLITWSLTGSISNVKLEYSTDGFATEDHLGTIINPYSATARPDGTPQNRYGYEWTIPKGAMCKNPTDVVAIRITSSDQLNEPSNTVISPNTFIVKGSIEMLHPHTAVVDADRLNANDTTYDIEWKTTGDLNAIPTAKLRLWLSVENEPEHTPTIITSIADPGSDNTTNKFRWPIVPDLIHTNKVMIKGVLLVNGDEDQQISDETSPFTIRAKLSVTYPIASTDYIIHDKQNQYITWRRDGSLNTNSIDINLVDSAETQIANIANDVPAAGVTGSLLWSTLNPANLDGDDFKIKITDHDATSKTLAGISAAPFKIRGLVAFVPGTVPGKDEVWGIGEEKVIQWTKTGPMTTIVLEYAKDNSGVYSSITNADGQPINELPATPTSFTWKVPSAARSKTCKLRIREDRVDGEENPIIEPLCSDVRPAGADTFIVRGKYVWSTPAANSVWELQGAAVPLKWQTYGGMATVRLVFSPNNRKDWFPVDAGGLEVIGDNGNKNWSLNPAKPGVTVANPAIILLQDPDDSEAQTELNIKIKGKLSFDSPTSGTTWKAGEPATISWNKIGDIGLVKIEYIGGASGSGLIAEHVQSDDGSCPWTIIPPGAVGSIIIRITQETTDPEPPKWESDPVSVRANFVFDAPTASTVWYVDDPADIIWTTYGDVNWVILKYWSKLGSWEPISPKFATNLQGDRKTTFPWPNVPDNIADNVQIKIEDWGGSGTVSDSLPFKIRGLITLAEPAAPLKIGRPYPISWTEKGHASQVEIWFIDSDGGETQLNNGNPIANSKSYMWPSVADVSLPCEEARFRIKTVGYDIQDTTEYFKVVPDFDFSEPGSNEYFKVNDIPDNTTIKWTCTSINAPWVNLDYAIVNNATGSDWKPVTTEDAANPGQWPWLLTKTSDCSSTAYIRITSKINGATVQGQAKSSKFYLRPVFNLEVPNGGEKFIVGKENYIRWTCAGKLNPVMLMYSASGDFSSGDAQFLPNVPPEPAEADGLVPNTQVPPAVNQFNWIIPDGLFSDHARIRVTAPDGINGMDDSTGTFMIVAGFDVDSPLETDQPYKVGGSIPIKWRCSSSGANVEHVKLAYSLENGEEGTYHIFASNLDNPANAGDQGQFSWDNIGEDMISNNAKINVINQGDSDSFQESGPFVIQADLDFLQPGGTAEQTLTVGDPADHPLLLQWKCKGIVATVKFQYSFNKNDANSWVDLPGAESVINPAPDAQGIREFTVAGGVPDIIGTAVWFRVVDNVSGHPAASAVSDNPCRVKGTISIIDPHNDQQPPPESRKLAMEIGNPFDITWTMKGSIPNVIIDYCSRDNGNFTPGKTYPIDSITTADHWDEVNFCYKYRWPQVPDDTNGDSFIRIRDSRTEDYPETVDVSDIFRIKGYVKLLSPNGDQVWKVKDPQSISWEWGGTLEEFEISLSKNGANGDYVPIPIPADGIVTIDTNLPQYKGGGTYTLPWEVADAISDDVWIKVTYPGDTGVYDISDKKFKIYGGLQLNAPTNNDRWVAREDKLITWSTTGTIPTVKLEYLKYNADGSLRVILDEDNNVIDDGIETIKDAAPNTGADLGKYLWSVAKDRWPYVKIRISDPRDPTNVVALSGGYFKIDYYTVQFYIRDLITDSVLTTLSVSGSSNKGSPVDTWKTTWMPGTEDDENPVPLGCSVGVPITVDLPAGYWRLIWSKTSFSDVQVNFSLISDLILDMPPESDTDGYFWNEDGQGNIHMETTAVHIWRAYSDFSYAPDPDGIGALTDSISVSSWLERDGFVVSGGQKVDIYIYDGPNQIRHLEAPGADAVGAKNPDNAGFFHMIWENTGLQVGKVYTVIADITNAAGKHFRTPTSFSITEAKKLQETQDTVNRVLNKPITEVETDITRMIAGSNVTQEELVGLGGMKGVVEKQLNDQTSLIVGPDKTKADIMAAGGMVGMLESSLSAFEKNATLAIEDLQSGANKAVLAGEELQATAKKYSWKASSSPDPALSGDQVSIQLQGQPDLLPMLSIYSWDNKPLASDVIMTETRPGFYVYEFNADVARFTPGKAYTYLITEQVTQGLVTGSGMVESMGISTVAGLAAAAPEAERAAKKALEAIKAVEAVLVSNENINIALTLKNLKESVEELPDILSREGPDAKLISAINDISDRIKTFVGKEGVDLGSLLDEKLGDASTLKDVRNKTDTINAIVDILLQIMEGKFGGVDSPIISTSMQSGSVKFRIIALNPSKMRTQKVQVKKYLPEEVKPKDVMDAGDLELEFDAERSIYYVYKNDVELKPGEARIFEVEVEDIWTIPQGELTALKGQAGELMAKFEKSPYLAKAKEVIDPISPLLEEMAKSQADDSVSRERHIGIYRQNTQNIKAIQERLAELEKMLEPPKGVKTPDLLEKKLKINLPSKTTTWLIIMIVIAFLGLLAGIFFFVWQGQIRSSQNTIDEARKSSFPGKNAQGGGEPPAEKK